MRTSNTFSPERCSGRKLYGLPGRVPIFMICSLQNIETDTESRELSMPIRAYCTPQAANPLAFDLEQL